MNDDPTDGPESKAPIPRHLPAKGTQALRAGLGAIGFLFLCLFVGLCSPAMAKGQWSAQIEGRAVLSDVSTDQGDEFDSSGIGVMADISFGLEPSTSTRIEAEGQAGVFDYRDESRPTRTPHGAALTVTQQLSPVIELRLRARAVAEVALLEARSADQASAAARLQWEQGNNRLRVEAEYRERRYDLADRPKGDGYRLTAQYNRRLGSWNWFRLEGRIEDMESTDAPRLSFERQSIAARYSQPLAREWQARAGIEYRAWQYDERPARGDPEGRMRKDRYVAPQIGLVHGGASGFYARAEGEYRFAHSNDERFGKDAPRLSLTLGYRF